MITPVREPRDSARNRSEDDNARLFMDEQLAVSAVWREALAIILRYPSATIVPAVVLAALADAPY
jgi:hypothetical protein